MEVAKMRNSPEKASRRMSKKWDDEKLDVIGAVGEIVVASYYPFATYNFTALAGGDGGVDMELDDGRKMAIKYNHRDNGHVIVEARAGDSKGNFHDIAKVDGIVTVTGPCDPQNHICFCGEICNVTDIPVEVTINGWIIKESFYRHSTDVDWGLGPRHYVPQACVDIQPFDTLIKES